MGLVRIIKWCRPVRRKIPIVMTMETCQSMTRT